MYSIFGLKDNGKLKERCCYYDEENLQVINVTLIYIYESKRTVNAALIEIHRLALM